MERKGGIYQIKNKINGKIYVGSTKSLKLRFKRHKYLLNKGIHDNKHLQNAWDKYGCGAFTFDVIEYVERESELIAREQHHIDLTECHNRNFGYNIRKFACSNLGIKIDNPISGEKHHWYGKRHSAETIKKMSKSQSGEKHSQYGKSRSEESKHKTSLSMKGKKSGSKHHNASLNEYQVRWIKVLLRHSDLRNIDIASIFNIKPEVVSKIKTGYRWSNVKI